MHATFQSATTVVSVTITNDGDLFFARSDDLAKKFNLGLYVSATTEDELKQLIPAAITDLFQFGKQVRVRVGPFVEPDRFLDPKPPYSRFAIERLAA